MNTRLLRGARLLPAWRSWTSERGLSPDAVERTRDGGARRNRQRVAFAILALALLPVLLVMSRDFGVTWDEATRQANGERIWALYHGIPQAEKGYLYGGLFDVSAVALQHVEPGHGLLDRIEEIAGNHDIGKTADRGKVRPGRKLAGMDQLRTFAEI